MATDESYEIMPYKEIVELKKQIAALQQKTGDTSSKELLNSMAALTKSMNNMLQLFSSAAEEMKLEEKEESVLSEKIGPLMEKVDRLEYQNKTIAEGLVAIADMVKEVKEVKEERIRKVKPIPRPAPEPKPEFPSFESPELPPLEPPWPTGAPMPPPGPLPTRSPRFVPRGPMPPPRPMPPPPMRGPPMPPPGEPFDFGGLPPLPPLEEEEPKKKGIMGMFKKK